MFVVVVAGDSLGTAPYVAAGKELAESSEKLQHLASA